MQEVDKCNASSSDWNVLYWILGTVLMPVALPLALINVWQRMRAHKYRNQLPGKVVLITGASSGVGESLAHVFYRAGCKVILAARRVEELQRVKRDLMALDVQPAYPATVLALDLAELNSIPEFATRALAVHNQVDILINNGGISVRADVASTTVDVDLKVMLVNYFGAVALTKALLPSMTKRQNGHICFVSSVQGKFAIPQRAAYSASKHALQAFADSLRAEVFSKQVFVSCISPGYVRTQMSINALTGAGKNYGKMDPSTAKGMSPDKLAESILQCILRKEPDILICDLQPKIAYYLRHFCPRLFFWIMTKRAAKLEHPGEKND
ncbi:dehydrogenase/reductase SDR family protein 7-like [Scaptodrosophila lebanonensis]|uniref:Dehydrogenase/reductase SDR family protein 7-like n=1 Tax=Drosophila lebanonensis TaxID=7225 RepID=A0A6J2SZE3_DROLE|nr:dehydrogenase/reductase SDR family protein 7-like [Scaptodrosophila lebanonensis]